MLSRQLAVFSIFLWKKMFMEFFFYLHFRGEFFYHLFSQERSMSLWKALFCKLVNLSVSLPFSCSPTHTHAHARARTRTRTRATLPRPLLLFKEQLTDPRVASTLTCPKHGSRPVAFCLLPHTTAWRKGDSPPPTALFLSVCFTKWAKNPSAIWEFLCFPPHATVAALSPTSHLPWSLPGEWSLLDSSPVHPVCRTGSESPTSCSF